MKKKCGNFINLFPYILSNSIIMDLVLRLCLVRCKSNSECKMNAGEIFSGKENIFMCLVAFQKMFWKIFFSVWLCS